ncbi:4137_t:CDS:1, partial [Funneliformis geosporum]
MANMHTIKDLSLGYYLSSACEIELEEALRISSKSVSKFTNKYNDLLGVYSNFEKRSNREKVKLNRNLKQADTNIGKLSK